MKMKYKQVKQKPRVPFLLIPAGDSLSADDSFWENIKEVRGNVNNGERYLIYKK